MVSQMFKNEELLYLKGYLKGKGFNRAVKAVNLAEELHSNAVRKSGEPYISHPCRIANALISLKVDDEDILIATILHDVLEDTDIKATLLEEYFGENAVRLIKLVTKEKGVSTKVYYNNISKDKKATIIKVADRCHNVSTMYFFTEEKMKEYIEETEVYILPMCSSVSNEHPQVADYLYSMKYQIESILETSKFFLRKNKGLT